MGSSSVNSEIIVASIFLVGGGLAGFLGATFFFDARGARAEMEVIQLEKNSTLAMISTGRNTD